MATKQSLNKSAKTALTMLVAGLPLAAAAELIGEVDTDKLIDGSPKNAITAVPVPSAIAIPAE